MAYLKTTWVDKVTPLSAENLNKIEDGIDQLYTVKADKTDLDNVQSKVSQLSETKADKTVTDALNQTIANMFSARDVLLDYTDTTGEKTFLKTKDNYKLILFIMKCGQGGYEKTQVFYPAYLVSGLAVADSFSTTSTFYYLASITASGINITTITSTTKLRIIGIK